MCTSPICNAVFSGQIVSWDLQDRVLVRSRQFLCLTSILYSICTLCAVHKCTVLTRPRREVLILALDVIPRRIQSRPEWVLSANHRPSDEHAHRSYFALLTTLNSNVRTNIYECRRDIFTSTLCTPYPAQKNSTL